MTERAGPTVVLFNPAPRSGWQAQRRVEMPLSLLCPATPLDRAGWNVVIIDEYAQRDWRRRLHLALQGECVCFGVTCMTGPQILHAISGCKIVRRLRPDVPIVWGGIHASLLPEQTLASGLADVVVTGEGEETFPQLVEALTDGRSLEEVAGIVFSNGHGCHFTAPRGFVDLDAQPPLSYHLVNINDYRRRLFDVDHVSFNSSRGCTHKCKFCWDPVMHKRRWRAMQPGTVMEHLQRIIRDYGIRGFLFTDDNFFTDLDRAMGILEAVVRSGLDISISKLQVRADLLCRMDADFFDLLVRAKVRRISIGVESGSQRLLDMVDKDLTVEEIVEANRRLLHYPIVPIYLFMMGLPGETPQDFAESVRLAVQLTDENPHAVKTFNVYTPYPGTELFDVVVQQGLKPPERLEDWASFSFRRLSGSAPWLTDQTRRLIKGLDFPLMFLGKGQFVTPYKKTNPIVVALARMYYPMAKYRVKHLDARLPIESKLVRALGLFARRD